MYVFAFIRVPALKQKALGREESEVCGSIYRKDVHGSTCASIEAFLPACACVDVRPGVSVCLARRVQVRWRSLRRPHEEFCSREEDSLEALGETTEAKKEQIDQKERKHHPGNQKHVFLLFFVFFLSSLLLLCIGLSADLLACCTLVLILSSDRHVFLLPCLVYGAVAALLFQGKQVEAT